LRQRYLAIRDLSTALIEPLSDADASLQSMEDASPAKWHLAHTSWFFETFVLRERQPGYTPFDPAWPFLFNSYYEAEGPRLARPLRGMLSRPSIDAVMSYRAHVDERMLTLCDDPACTDLIELGLAHEQQHQELLLTDIKHALFQNPMGPAMWARPALPLPCAGRNDVWRHSGGVERIGHRGHGFAFDLEGPSHEVLLQPFRLSHRLVCNADWEQFVADGGYRTPSLWLSEGWTWMQREHIEAPLYWRKDQCFTHAGWQDRDPDAPVTHVSYFEADAYARWANARLPTEFEWEAIAKRENPAAGQQLDAAGPPIPSASNTLFGSCWQWTRSSLSPYPRFRPPAGAIGEYNGKFMSGQFVLKGASCATPRGHSRSSYRNFFYPQQRWQFTGVRLAWDS